MPAEEAKPSCPGLTVPEPEAAEVLETPPPKRTRNLSDAANESNPSKKTKKPAEPKPSVELEPPAKEEAPKKKAKKVPAERTDQEAPMQYVSFIHYCIKCNAHKFDYDKTISINLP